MADWQHLLQSIFIGLLFSYLLAKLISIVVSFQNDNLHITRNPKPQSNDTTHAPAVHHYQHSHGDVDSVVAEQGSVRNESASGSDGDGGDDDDWEGVESTELDEMFSAATVFVAAAAADRVSLKVSSDLQLQLYGYYKIATEGPCTSPPPSALKMTARAKWQAWQKLGAMPPEDAMQKYIDIITELYPTWDSGSAMNKGRDGVGSSKDGKGPMGPVLSTFVYEEESGTELKMDAIHAFAREGEVNNLIKCIDGGVSVNLKDSEGRTPLHWAVDRGHLNIAEVLVGKNADVNAKDKDGQTPLHYAAVCEREAIAEYLVKQNADTDARDNDDQSAHDLCESDWPFLQLPAA
uniref:ACB domain-containing protein n=1 Tax=Salix viminalis TaxID=40686 RepID=A0A6N2LKK1_SALVM